MYKYLSKPKLIIVIFLSILLTFFTTISLIFINVPKFIYMNIIGTFLISFIFGPIGGVVFNILVSVAKLKFGLVDTIINYPFLINIFESLFIGIVVNLKLSLNKKFIIYIIALPITIKPLGIITYNLVFTNIDLKQVFELLQNYFNNNLISSLSIYVFSAFVTYFIYRLLLNRKFKEEIKNG